MSFVRTRVLPLVVVPALAALVCAAVPQAAATPLSGILSLGPSRAEGIAVTGEQVGPFTLRNGTDQTVQASAFPVLIGQRRDGGIFVHDEAASRLRARQLLAVDRPPAQLASGSTYTAIGRVRRPTAAHNLYAGILFRSAPTGPATGSVIRQVLQINASVFLDPPLALQRVRLGAESIRAEQAGPRRIRLLVPVRNQGNVAVHAAGGLRITTAAGTPAAALRLSPPAVPILPGATVELPAMLTKVLGPGRYTLKAPVVARSRRITAVGTMELFGPNTLAVRDAKLIELHPPMAYSGEPVGIEASFRNTGNLAYRPDATAELQQVGQGGVGPVVRRIPLKVDRPAPGAKGRIHGSLKLPSHHTYELTLRLSDGPRELDSRSVSLTPQQRPDLLQRILDWISGHPLAMLGIFLGGMAAVAVATAAHVRRRARPPGGAGVQAAPAAPSRPPAGPVAAPLAPPVAPPEAAPEPAKSPPTPAAAPPPPPPPPSHTQPADFASAAHGPPHGLAHIARDRRVGLAGVAAVALLVRRLRRR